MSGEEGIFVGGGGEGHAVPQRLILQLANRHGLIAGATGTGKTVTMQILAEGFSAAGVPVFMADVKGDVAGMALPGNPDDRRHDAFLRRAAQIGYAGFGYRAFPVVFWDIWGERGHPIRATVAEMGPLLLSRMLELTEAQEGVMNVAFRVADDEGLPLLDLRDLQAIIAWVGENARALSLRYGNVATASVGAIQRRLLVLETQGADRFLGEPALSLADLMVTDAEGRGRINLLAAERLMTSPRLYATFLLWLLSELFEELPEVGDPPRPRLVFFFDEAHLLFRDAPRALVEKVEQVARLIRSKGVGVYFVTQNPADVPESVLAQLGNRVQHALRVFTPNDARALKAAADTYRPNPRFPTAEAIRDLGTGEAVTSFLEGKGNPGVVERTLVRPPATRLGPLTDAERAAALAASPVAGRYDRTLDRDSAHEMLARGARRAGGGRRCGWRRCGREFAHARRYSPAMPAPRGRAAPRAAAGRGDSVAEAFAKSFARQIGTRTGAAVARGIFGTLFRGR